MDPELRSAWTEIVSAADYDLHMAAIGQAQAAAELTAWQIHHAAIPAGGHILICGAGTGQLLDFLDPAILRPYRFTCTDLNPRFLDRLRERLASHRLKAEVLQDDIEQTRLIATPDLLLATLLLEHIDWRRGVESFAALQPRYCGIILQGNPPEMESAVTPGRPLPPTIAKAVEKAHPVLIPAAELAAAMVQYGFHCADRSFREVADGKKLVSLLFAA